MQQTDDPTTGWSLDSLHLPVAICEGLTDDWIDADLRGVAGRTTDPSWWGSIDVPDGLPSGNYRLRLPDASTWIFLIAAHGAGSKLFVGSAGLPRRFVTLRIATAQRMR